MNLVYVVYAQGRKLSIANESVQLSLTDPAPQAECFSCAGVSAAHEKNNLSAPSASLR
jgi:hypothetical protein